MRPSFHPRLINGPFDDPGLLVTMPFRKRALLFDLGDLRALPPKDTLKIDHVYVSHTHMDHFIGFDQLLRALLGRDKTLSLYGPHGFLNNLTGKLNAYTWNLVHNYTAAVRIHAIEISGQKATAQTFDCHNGFEPSQRRTYPIHGAVVHQEPIFSVTAAQLDHQIPSLAYSLQESRHVNILKTELDKLGLAVGPWITSFKNLIHTNADPDTPIFVPNVFDKVPNTQPYTLKELSGRVARITQGQKIAYVADVVYNSSNIDKIATLAHGADHLFIEAAFLHAEKRIAAAKFHLTAHQAGAIARRAQVKQMSIFHHSPRYAGQAHLLEQEARAAFES